MTACKSIHYIFGLLALGLFYSAADARARGRAPWHQGNSPYRAVFKITHPPSNAKAGIGVSVPVCGLGHAEGADLFAFDDNGIQLPLYPLGKSKHNEVGALVAPRQPTGQLYLYFGSNSRAPVHQRAFVPGLTVDIRTLPAGPFDTWQQVETLLQNSARIGRIFVDNIALSYNPIDSTDAMIMVFDGHLQIPETGDYTFMLVSDDAGFLFIDDELLISRGGRHYASSAVRGENRQQVKLEAGLRPIRCVVVEAGGDQMAVVARWIDGHNKFILPPEFFLRSGKTELVSVQPRYPDAPLAAFWIRHLSYMSFEGAQYTEVELGTYNNEPAAWHFDDGAKLTGARVKRVIPGLENRGVTVTQKRQKAAGKVYLPEQPPAQHRMSDSNPFNHYTELILGLNLADLHTSVLKGYLKFLNYVELNSNAIPVYEALLQKQDLTADDRFAALLGLARSAAAEQPEKADKAYQQLFRHAAADEIWRPLARECGEFVLFRQRDFKAAENLLARMSRRLSRQDAAVVSLTLDLFLQQTSVEQARDELSKLLSLSAMSEKHRFAVVKSNALRQRFYDLLENGFILAAREELWAWEDLAPADRLDGSLSLARSRLFQTLSWYDGALAVLDGAMLLDPLLPNLPEVEFERAKIFSAVGDTQKANDLFMRIATEYPNHPVATKSRGSLK